MILGILVTAIIIGMVLWIVGLITQHFGYENAPAFFYIGLYFFMVGLFPLTITFLIVDHYEMKRSLRK